MPGPSWTTGGPCPFLRQPRSVEVDNGNCCALLSESGASSFSLFRFGLVVKDTDASLAIAATLRRLSQRHDASALGALPFPLSYLDANPTRQRITELIFLARLFPRLGCRRTAVGDSSSPREISF